MAHGGVFQLDLDDNTTSQPLEEEDSDDGFDDDVDVDDEEFIDAIIEEVGGTVDLCTYKNDQCAHMPITHVNTPVSSYDMFTYAYSPPSFT